MMRHIRNFILLFLLLCPVVAYAGFDAASVSEDRIPWSGYWWPETQGELVRGYLGHPSTLEKYDAYISGYYPAAAVAYGLENEYDPNTLIWAGHCDDWAAASILEPEPAHAGDIAGIPFSVGDKKGLLTLYYDGNVNSIFYGSRYNGPENDGDDIYPGGSDGFHQTLINYISIQNLPIIMDIDPHEQIWNYPAYKYEMEWNDVANARFVSCKVWFASDNVVPDHVGTVSFAKTYTYKLVLDDEGNLTDEPGSWIDASVNDHPDFMWYPVFSGSKTTLDQEAIYAIVNAESTKSADRFEANNQMNSGHKIDLLQKNRFYAASSTDDDWFQVALNEGDDFYAFAVSYQDEVPIHIFDPNGNSVGYTFYNGAKIDRVPQSGNYYVYVSPMETNHPFYNIEFFSSPVTIISHVALNNGWDSNLTVLNSSTDNFPMNLRFNLFDSAGGMIDAREIALPAGKLETYALARLFSDYPETAGWLKIVNLDANENICGYYGYEQADKQLNLPYATAPSRQLYIPHIAVSDQWWMGLSLINTDSGRSVTANMKLFDATGDLLAAKDMNLNPGQKRVGLLQSFWENNLPQEAAWMELISDSPMDGMVLYGNIANRNNQGLSGIPLLSEQKTAQELYLPHFKVADGWWTGIALVNPVTESVKLEVTGYGVKGTELATGQINLAPKANWVGIVQDIFENWDEKIAWIKINADHAVGGFMLFGYQGQQLAQLLLPSVSDTSTDWYLPDISVLENSWSGLNLLNPGNKKANVWAKPYDADGNELLSGDRLWYNVPVGLEAMSNVALPLEDMFPGLPANTAYLHIHSSVPVLGFGMKGDMTGKASDLLYLQRKI